MTARMAGLLLWLLVGGLAASALFWQLKHPPQPPVAPNAKGTRAPELPTLAPTQPFQLPPLTHYADITAHPVFIAARQPEPPPPVEDAPAEKPQVGSEPTTPILMGVMILSQAKVALLRPEEPNAKTVRAKVGDKVGEWLLEAIFPNRVVLQKGTEKHELKLARPKKPVGSGSRKQNSPGPKPAPVVAPPAPLPQPDLPLPLIAPNPPQP